MMTGKRARDADPQADRRLPIIRYFALLLMAMGVGCLGLALVRLARPGELPDGDTAAGEAVHDVGWLVVAAVDAADAATLTSLCNEAVQQSSGIDAIAVFGGDGRILALNSVYRDGAAIASQRVEQVLAKNFDQRPIITRCLNNSTGDEVVEFQTTCDITPALFDSSGLSIAHSVPVYDGAGRQVGVLSTRVRFDRLTSLIEDGGIAGGAGYIRFVSDAGEFFDEQINGGLAPPPMPADALAELVAPLVEERVPQHTRLLTTKIASSVCFA